MCSKVNQPRCSCVQLCIFPEVLGGAGEGEEEEEVAVEVLRWVWSVTVARMLYCELYVATGTSLIQTC